MRLQAVWNSSTNSNSWDSSKEFQYSLMTTDRSADAEEALVSSHPLYKVSLHLWFFGPPVILLVGNFGNVMTVVIMQRQRTGEAVINLYFTALAIVDLVVLDVLFLDEWVGMAFGYHIHSQHDLLCKVRNWTGGVTTGSGAWFLVSLTAHRAVSVVWPHRVSSLCTRRLVGGVLAAITAFLAVVYSHFLYGYYVSYSQEAGGYICVIKLGGYAAFIQEVFAYVDLTIYSLLPFVGIFLANSVLIWKLKATIRDVRHRVAEKESVATRQRAARSVTVTIITVSVAYVTLTLPVSIYFISLFVQSFDSSGAVSVRDQARNYLIRAVTFLLMYGNSSVNFYLYCLTGARFRKEFVKVFCSTRGDQFSPYH